MSKSTRFFYVSLRRKKCQDLTTTEVQEEISDHEKRTKQNALNVVMNAKFHSNLLKVEMFFVAIASKRNEDSKFITT